MGKANFYRFVIAGDEEFDYFFNKAKMYWERDIWEPISHLATFCADGGLIGVVSQRLDFVPDIQA